MKRVDDLLAQITREEQLLIDERNRRSERHGRNTEIVILIGGALNFGLLDLLPVIGPMRLKAKQDAERDLRVSEARFREIFSASAVGIAISDLDGALVEANQAFADLVGRRAHELVGSPILELLRAGDDTESAHLVSR